MERKIGRKTFKLTKVNIKMRNLYAELADLSADLSKLGQEAYSINDEIALEEEPETRKELAAQRQAVRKRYEELDDRRRELAEKIVAKREELLITVLAKNGYDYDKDFWEEEADIEDINDIVTQMFKEASPGKR